MVSPAETPPLRPRREWAALAAILLLAFLIRSLALEANGWGAEYYSAAVRSMAHSWRNFFYCAFDPAGFISVDKPPLALWLQVASVRLFGFHPLSLLLPQVLLGTAAVGVLYFMLRPRAGGMASLLAALFLALTPVLVAVNRVNNTDSLLALALLLAAWALVAAVERGSRGLLLLASALVGLAFNVKMLAAFIALPVFHLVYLLAAPRTWPHRLLDLVLAGTLTLVLALSWVLAVELTPPESRPFVGSTQGNSMLELVVGHNAWGRFFAKAKPAQRPAPAEGERAAAPAPPPAASRAQAAVDQHLERLFVQTPTGPLRLFTGKLAAQAGWLLPLALLAPLLAPWRQGWAGAAGRRNLLILFWSAWAGIYVAVFSHLGGIFHYYYLAPLAPAAAALAGLGVAALWERASAGGRQALWPPLALLLTALWQLHLQASGLGWDWGALVARGPAWLGWLHLTLAGGCLIAALGLGWAWLGQPRPRLAGGALALGLAACLALPTAWGVSSALRPGLGMAPSADLLPLAAPSPLQEEAARARRAQAGQTARLARFLLDHQSGERYLLAATTTHLAAPLIIATGQPVMARGGFHGLDPAITPEGLARLAREGRVRFVMLGDEALVSRRMGAAAAAKPIADWVRAHGQPVDPALWRSGRAGARMELWDLRGDTFSAQAPPPSP